MDYPNVKFILREAHSGLLEKLLLSGEVDFAILNAPIKSRETTSVLIRNDEVLLAVPPFHPFAGYGEHQEGKCLPTIDIALFKQDKFIFQYPDQRTRQVADHILEQAKIEPNILLETRSIETALKMVSKGMGLCFVPETYVKGARLEVSPVYFSLNSPNSILELSLAYLKNIYLPKYFQDFIKVVKEKL